MNGFIYHCIVYNRLYLFIVHGRVILPNGTLVTYSINLCIYSLQRQYW